MENFKQLESSQKNQKNIKKDKIQKRLSYNAQRKQERSIKKLKNRVSKLEKEIQNLENSQKRLDADLAIPDKFKELSQKEGFFDDYNNTSQKLKELIEDWEQAIEKLSKLE